MDPLTILSLVETCAGLSVTAGKLAIGLKTLAGNYQTASMTFRSLSGQCRLFASAVRAIQSWMDEAPDQGRLDDSIWEQLADSLEVANDAIYALETELTSTSGGSVNSFWEKINVVWNMPNLKSLEDCIHKQVSSLSLILQIMSLPTFQGQKESLRNQRAVFDDSRSSAMSLADPDSSTIRGGDSASVAGAVTIMTRLSQIPTFDFDEMLMASQVYLRNRNKTMALHSSKTRSGNTRDMGVSVSAWDLRYPVLNRPDIDIMIPADLDAESLRLWVANEFLPTYELLYSKYSKVKGNYFDMQHQRDELDIKVKNLTKTLEIKVENLTKTLEISPQDSEEGLRAEIGILKKQQDWNEKQIQYWMDQYNGGPSSATDSSTLIGSPNSSLRSSLISIHSNSDLQSLASRDAS